MNFCRKFGDSFGFLTRRSICTTAFRTIEGGEDEVIEMKFGATGVRLDSTPDRTVQTEQGVPA